jgi:hypothetical protein
MSATLKLTESIQDGVLAAVETSQRWTTDAVKTISGSLDSYLPARPAIPFADSLPNPVDALKLSFDFAEKLLAANRAFVTDLVGLAGTPEETPAGARRKPATTSAA